MPEDPVNNDEGLEKAISTAVNNSGFPFQARVMREAYEACIEGGTSEWLLDSAEFPIHVNGRDSRIDLLLMHRSLDLYLSIECKRANPRFSRWVFLELSQSRRRNPDIEYMHLDFARPGKNTSGSYGAAPDPGKISGFTGPSLENRCYHFAVAAKKNTKSGEDGRRTNAIEEAVSQAALGANGVLDHFASTWKPRDNNNPPIGVLPVVVTTASLYSISKDISTCDLADGTIPITDGDISLEKWLYYQYPMSHGIRPNSWEIASDSRPWQVADLSFYRTVVICNSAHFASMLQSLRSDWLTPFRPIEVPSFW